MNESVRFGDRVFHIQTEDLGTNKGLVVSQIFCEGRILHSQRTDYREKLALPHPDIEVKKLLLRQHRDMHRLIQQGELEKKLEPSAAQPVLPPQPPPAAAAAPEEAVAAAALAVPAAAALAVPAAAALAVPAAAALAVPAAAALAVPPSAATPAEPVAPPAPPLAPDGQQTPAGLGPAEELPKDELGRTSPVLGSGDLLPPAATTSAYETAPATGFLADLVSARRFDLLIALELARLEAEGSDAR
ncbi:MAG: hypothetical protein FJ125_10015 [Deltaproteobacteria bacterium]|nr:hypothetical protein [Deltaproteobacteria bacterium]